VSGISLNTLMSRLQSPLFNLVVDDRALSLPEGTDGYVSHSDARGPLVRAGLLEAASAKIRELPVLITARGLCSDDWINLLLVTDADYVVISTRHIGSGTDMSDEVVGRYVATSVALETLVAYGLRKNGEILENRTPGLNTGCLCDFHRTRETYVERTQHPELCDAEAAGIKKLFGEGTVAKMKAVLKRIGGDTKSDVH
jgi:hypothetical protein